MNRYAIVFNGLVLNIAVSDVAIDEGWILIDDGAGVAIGWKYENGEFSE
jgi:hypothetical protein